METSKLLLPECYLVDATRNSKQPEQVRYTEAAQKNSAYRPNSILCQPNQSDTDQLAQHQGKRFDGRKQHLDDA
jgi:hypothetical protein